MQQKVLVCITIQENSRRLISQGFNISRAAQASLHILHVRQGETIFDNPESSSLLEELFDFGGELGGEVHFLCSNHIPQTILDFIIDHQITHLLLGEAPIINDSENKESVYEQLLQNVPNISISVLSREDSKFQEV